MKNKGFKDTHKAVWVVTVDSYDTEELETWVWDVYDFKPSKQDLELIAQEILDGENEDTKESLDKGEEDYSRDMSDWKDYNSLDVHERTLCTRRK